jgi:hypothetical protein
MARSSWIALGVAVWCGGCDLAFGVDPEEQPCDVSSFDDARYTEITHAFDFSINWDQTRGVVVDTFNYDLALPGGDRTPIDLGLYSPVSVALVPEGNALFYTISVEPEELHGALRNTNGTWLLGATVPRGTVAGTPSADVFGPRRVVVQMRAGDAAVQEYEDAGGRWVTVGDPHPLVAETPPNLTPNGLTAVFSRSNDDGSADIFMMTRASTADWFGEPTKILGAADHHPQLLGNCKRLYTAHEGMLRRYDR